MLYEIHLCIFRMCIQNVKMACLSLSQLSGAKKTLCFYVINGTSGLSCRGGNSFRIGGRKWWVDSGKWRCELWNSNEIFSGREKTFSSTAPGHRNQTGERAQFPCILFQIQLYALIHFCRFLSGPFAHKVTPDYHLTVHIGWGDHGCTLFAHLFWNGTEGKEKPLIIQDLFNRALDIGLCLCRER